MSRTERLGRSISRRGENLRSSGGGGHVTDYAADVLVKIGSSVEAYKKNYAPSPGGLGSLLVNMGNSTATVGGYRPSSRLSNEDRLGAVTFVRQFSMFVAQDASERSSLSFCERGDGRARSEYTLSNYQDAVEEQDQIADDENELRSEEESGQGQEGDDLSPDRKEEIQDEEEDDPFAFSLDDNVSIRSPDEDDDDMIQNQLNITVYGRGDEQMLQMRALLDTAAVSNIMREELANKTGHQVEPIPSTMSGRLILADGRPLTPIGIVRLRWYFNERFSAARSYEIPFLVCPDEVLFDVILGYRFLRKARLFKFNEYFAMVLTPSDRQKREREAAEEKARKKRDRERLEQREKDRKDKKDKQDKPKK